MAEIQTETLDVINTVLTAGNFKRKDKRKWTLGEWTVTTRGGKLFAKKGTRPYATFDLLGLEGQKLAVSIESIFLPHLAMDGEYV